MLFVVFLVLLILKLAGAITFSWWLVTLPLWIIPAMWAVFAALGLTTLTFVGLLAKLFGR